MNRTGDKGQTCKSPTCIGNKSDLLQECKPSTCSSPTEVKLVPPPHLVTPEALSLTAMQCYRGVSSKTAPGSISNPWYGKGMWATCFHWAPMTLCSLIQSISFHPTSGVLFLTFLTRFRGMGACLHIHVWQISSGSRLVKMCFYYRCILQTLSHLSLLTNILFNLLAKL